MKKRIFKRMFSAFIAAAMILAMIPAIMLPAAAWTWEEDGECKVASYNATIVEEGTISIDAQLESAYLNGTKITSYPDEEPYRCPGFESVWNEAKGDFSAYVTLDTHGMYIFAEIGDDTIFDNTYDYNASEGDYFKIYLDWCEPSDDPAFDMAHPQAEHMYEYYLKNGSRWETDFKYRDMYGYTSMMYLGWIALDYHGMIASGGGFSHSSSLGLMGDKSIEYETNLTSLGWKCEVFIPWREESQGERVANGEQFHCGIGFEVGDDTDLFDKVDYNNPEKSVGMTFDQRKEIGLLYYNGYSSLADLMWGEYPEKYWKEENSFVEGSCGGNLVWKFNTDTRNLTISGDGEMSDYTVPENFPWNTFSLLIETITIENGVKSISNKAFYGCESLKNVIIASSVMNIGNSAFSNCNSLESVTFLENSKLTNINDFTFSNCSSLTSITIPDGVTSIGNCAFSGCNSLASITMPDSLTSIGDEAFNCCSALTSLKILPSITSIGNFAFCNCIGLKDIYVTDVEAWLAIDFGEYYSNPNCYGNLHILDENGNEVCELIIPEGVTEIITDAFYNCKNITSITIPESVTIIGLRAFYNCSNVTNISFAKNNKLTSIGGNAFQNCSSLTSIIIPEKVKTIGNNAFRDCNSLTSVTFERNSELIAIGMWAFYRCTNLTRIYIPNSIVNIGERAFFGCGNITKMIYCGTLKEWDSINKSKDWNLFGPHTVQFHNYVDGICTECGLECEHEMVVDDVCSTCGKTLSDVILGDVSGDGLVTNADVLIIYRYIYNSELYPLDVIVGDVNGDGAVTNADVLVIYRYIYNPALYPIG